MPANSRRFRPRLSSSPSSLVLRPSPSARERRSSRNAAPSPIVTNGTLRRSTRPTRRGGPRKTSWSPRLPTIRAVQGHARLSRPQKLADALELSSRLSKEFSRLYVYASMMSDQDTRVSTYQGMQQEMAQIGATFGAETVVHRAGDSEDRPGEGRRRSSRASRG